MMDRAFKDGIPGDVVLADAAYGSSGPFREYVLSLGKDFACGIQGDCLVHLLTPQGRRKGEPRKASDIASELGRKAFRRVTYRHGSKGKMASYFCLRRVKIAGPGEPSDARNTPLWLVMEWPEGEARPTKLALTSLGASASKREVVRVLKERWHTEQAYAELKGELGLDHFEGRSFPAWHHHITVVLSCYAFLVAERSRRFPPSEAAAESDAHAREAGAALRGLARVDATHPRQGRHALAQDLSAMRPRARCGRARVQELPDQGSAPAVVLGTPRGRLPDWPPHAPRLAACVWPALLCIDGVATSPPTRPLRQASRDGASVKSAIASTTWASTTTPTRSSPSSFVPLIGASSGQARSVSLPGVPVATTPGP
jgi:hypothetical protein